MNFFILENKMLTKSMPTVNRRHSLCLRFLPMPTVAWPVPTGTYADDPVPTGAVGIGLCRRQICLCRRQKAVGTARHSCSGITSCSVDNLLIVSCRKIRPSTGTYALCGCTLPAVTQSCTHNICQLLFIFALFPYQQGGKHYQMSSFINFSVGLLSSTLLLSAKHFFPSYLVSTSTFFTLLAAKKISMFHSHVIFLGIVHKYLVNIQSFF